MKRKVDGAARLRSAAPWFYSPFIPKKPRPLEAGRCRNPLFRGVEVAAPYDCSCVTRVGEPLMLILRGAVSKTELQKRIFALVKGTKMKKESGFVEDTDYKSNRMARETKKGTGKQVVCSSVPLLYLFVSPRVRIRAVGDGDPTSRFKTATYRGSPTRTGERWGFPRRPVSRRRHIGVPRRA